MDSLVIILPTWLQWSIGIGLFIYLGIFSILFAFYNDWRKK